MEQSFTAGRSTLDITTFTGLGISFTLILSAFIMEGGSIAALLQITAAMIIIGGTIGAVLVAFPASEVSAALSAARLLFTSTNYDVGEISRDLVEFSSTARREGVLALENYSKSHPHPLIQKGLQLLVDGTEPDKVEEILYQRIAARQNELHKGVRVFEAAGGYSPTMGIIGTVLGLISVLSNLDDPNELGPKIALAFVATFMGILYANLLWLPFANKLKVKAMEEKMVSTLIVLGLVSIQNGDSPRMMQEILNLDIEVEVE